MQLPEDDEEFLNSLGRPWRVDADGSDAGFLVVSGFDVSGGGFAPTSCDLMVRLPPRYPLAKLDMWYCSPAIKFASTNGYPVNADVFENFGGVSWQRFSRHLADGCWRPGIDGLRAFFRFIFKELQGK